MKSHKPKNYFRKNPMDNFEKYKPGGAENYKWPKNSEFVEKWKEGKIERLKDPNDAKTIEEIEKILEEGLGQGASNREWTKWELTEKNAIQFILSQKIPKVRK
jgi:hypothetical protein